jgi:hypothetical protein
MVSCKKEGEEFTRLDLSETSILNISEHFFEFDDKHPVSIHVKDSFAFILQVQSDTCVIVLNLNTKQVIQYLGAVGFGPGDLIRPDFITSVDNPDVLIEDGNLKKMWKIEADKKQNNFVFNKFADYPEKIFPSGENNVSENFIVGRKVGRGKMFYVYNRNTDSIIDIDFFPVIKDLKHDPNYIYAPALALNEEKNRIVAGMYFFDMFHLYDLNGKRIRTFCFSENPVPTLNSGDMTSDLENCRARIIRAFPTENYCFLLRIVQQSPADDITENTLIQIDWDGNLINTFHVKDAMEGWFYIIENERKMYAIRHVIKGDEDEIYEIVSYELNN